MLQRISLILVTLFLFPLYGLSASFYDFTVTSIEGEPVKLEKYRGKVVLVVNTASKCGFTPQLAELESLYKQYKDKGFIVLAFPSNDFKQELEENQEINKFARQNYGTTFPFFEKIIVTGNSKHPLYDFLTKQKSGIMMSEVSWNFEKFLINRNGKVVERFNSMSSPKGNIKKSIEKLL
jgi:glutathione peroxidase